MSMLDHDCMLNFFGKIYDLSKSNDVFRKKLNIESTDWAGNGTKTIKTKFFSIYLNRHESNRLLQININKVKLYDKSGCYSDRCEETRTEKETNLILKQIMFFDGVYNDHLDEQLEELDFDSGSGEEEIQEEAPEGISSLESLSAESLCFQQVAASAEMKWVLSSGGFICIFTCAVLFKIPFLITLGLMTVNYCLFMAGHRWRDEDEKKALCAKRGAPQKMIKAPPIDEMAVKSKELDDKSDAIDRVIRELDKL